MAHMHQLILLRHAKAAASTAGGSDHDRPLTNSGTNAAANIGRAMRQAGLAPDVVLVSPSLRTEQTFAALEAAGVWAEWPNVESLPALYMASPQQMRDILRDLPETVRSAMIIGHNPGLHELARNLAGTATAPRTRPPGGRLPDRNPHRVSDHRAMAANRRQRGPPAAFFGRQGPRLTPHNRHVAPSRSGHQFFNPANFQPCAARFRPPPLLHARRLAFHTRRDFITVPYQVIV